VALAVWQALLTVSLPPAVRCVLYSTKATGIVDREVEGEGPPRVATIVRIAGGREVVRRARQTDHVCELCWSCPHHETMNTGQYLAVLLDYAKPVHQDELELRAQPTVVSRQKLGPGVPIARAPLRYK